MKRVYVWDKGTHWKEIGDGTYALPIGQYVVKVVEEQEIMMKDIPVHICEEAPKDTQLCIIPRGSRFCPYCGIRIS